MAAPSQRSASGTDSKQLKWHEKLALGIGISEICLQLDSYLMYHEADAKLGAVGGINVSLLSLCLAYLYGTWIARAMVSPREPNSKLLINVPMLFYIGAVGLSVLAASVRALAMFDVILLVQSYALFLYLANRLRTERDIIFGVLVIGITLFIQGTFVIGLAAFVESGAIHKFGPIKLGVWPDGRPAGSVHSPVVAGSLMALTWIPVMALSLCAKQSIVRWTCITMTGVGMLAILLTQTRGAILTAAVGTLIIGMLLAHRNWLPKWAVSVAILFSLLGALPLAHVITNRVTGDDGGSASARKHLAEIAIATIQQAPIAGHGAGNCHLACERVAEGSLYRAEWYYTIHCKYLLVWVETGLIGLVTFSFMLGNSIRYGVSAWRRQRSRLLAVVGIGLSAAILGHMVHMLVDIFNSRSQVQLLWAVFGIAAAVYKLSHEPQDADVGRSPSYAT